MICTAVQVQPWHESAETSRLRNEFDRLKAQLRSRIVSSPERFSADERAEANEFTSGRKDPLVSQRGESITRRLLRQGIEDMEDFLSIL